MKADASANASSHAASEVDFDAEGDASWEDAVLPEQGAKPEKPRAPGSDGAASSQGARATAWLGARHDLRMLPGSAAKCQCLAVSVGSASEPGMTWQSGAPSIDTTTQLVIGLSSDKVACEKEHPQASYMGYHVKDADVIVQVEAAVAGRPLTQGAIIPRPHSGGRVLIEAVDGLPYGTALGGKGACVTYP